jgi:hypothetical protein
MVVQFDCGRFTWRHPKGWGVTIPVGMRGNLLLAYVDFGGNVVEKI